MLTGCPCKAVLPWLRNLLTDKHNTEQRGMIQNRLAECSPPACLSSADSSARAEPETEAAKTGNQKSKKPQPEQHAARSRKATVKVRQSRQSSMQHAMQHTACRADRAACSMTCSTQHELCRADRAAQCMRRPRTCAAQHTDSLWTACQAGEHRRERHSQHRKAKLGVGRFFNGGLSGCFLLTDLPPQGGTPLRIDFGPDFDSLYIIN